MDISALQSKVSEVKALFILAQRVIPFMEELFAFIGDTTPLLEEVNNTIKENLKKMPNATKQLTKVTQATETASTEIMDTVDRVNSELFLMIDELEKIKDINEQILVNPLQLLETIAEGIASGKDLTPLLTDINFFIDRMRNAVRNESVDSIVDIINRLRTISDDANTIINSLQVQDITAQQLAAVNHLLENIQSRLSGIMKHLNAGEIGDTKNAQFDESIKISKLHRDIAFDPDAVEAMSTANRQSDIDALLANPDLLSADTEENNETAENILNNFANMSNNDTVGSEVNSVEETTTTVETVDDEEFSQDDIDALFG